MFIITTRFSKKKAASVLLAALVLMAALVCFLNRPAGASDTDILLKDNQSRLQYLQSLGWSVAEEPLETLQLILPETLPENYIAYNQIQLAQGMDLRKYCGKPLTRYTYSVQNYPNRPDGVQLNLYLFQDRVIAGDIISSGSSGFQSGLLFPGQKPEKQ